MHARLVLRLSVLALWPALALAQSPKAATYLTDEQVKAINTLPGIDRQIVTTDIGKLNLSVGIVHRGSTNAPAPAAAGGGGGAAAAQQGDACGETSSAAAGAGTASGISHDGQTETYIIVSGGGTLVTGGKIVNGRKSAADSPVTQGAERTVLQRANRGRRRRQESRQDRRHHHHSGRHFHGWIDITDHVDYLSVRPDPDRLLAPYVNPALKK